MKYRKKPVVIEAIQFLDNGESISELSEFIDHTVRIGYKENPTTLTVCTLEGALNASLGDYIIKGINGEFYPCKPNIFDKTYEAVNN